MNRPETSPVGDDLNLLRIEQARLLKERVRGSCLIVEFIVIYTALVMAFMNSVTIAALWFALGTSMVLVTYAYAKLSAREGIDRTNYQRFLVGHCIISAITGAVWGGLAIYQIDYASEFTVFIACLTVCSITLGGVIPRSAYRPTYIALASASLPPLGLYIAWTAPEGIKLIGIGLLVYFLFTMFVSARVEIETHETISARNSKLLSELVGEKNRLFRIANEEKSRFLASVSHDMSQPLQSQRFFLHALRDTLQSPQQQELMEKVEQTWRAQRDLLHGLVEVARIDSGAILVHPESVALETQAQQLAEEFDTGEEDRPTLTTHFDPVSVKTDPVLLARILRNLLGNAFKFTPSGGTVHFSVKPGRNGAEIVISDTGPGIDEEDQERVFGEFVQLSEEPQTTSDSGMGLGLSIVQRLCKILDIEITLVSSSPTGCTFTLRVPEGAPQKLKDEANRVVGDKLHGSPLIVIADDDEAILNAMGVVLTGWGCKTITARSQAEAVTALSLIQADPDLLIIDLKLGKDNGLEVIRILREECNVEIPAILMSGNLGDTASIASQEGITCLHKPLDTNDLRLILQDMVPAHSDA